MTLSTDDTLVLIGIVAVISPILVELTGRLAIPDVVFELDLGAVIGPAVLGLAHPSSIIVALSDMGLSYLMFLAGVELFIQAEDWPIVRGSSRRSGSVSWCRSSSS